jgi:hypothetical protein
MWGGGEEVTPKINFYYIFGIFRYFPINEWIFR